MAKKILVIDDSATIRHYVALALQEAGFEVVEAIDGVDGVAKIDEHPDLAAVLCDLNMPRMGGMELLEKMRGLRPHLPILMLTTEGQPALIQRAKQAGARGWIMKPFRAEMLIATMRKVAA